MPTLQEYTANIKVIAHSTEEALKIKALLQIIANQNSKELVRVSDKVVKNPDIIKTGFKFI